MKEKILGIIGLGNIGFALLKGINDSGLFSSRHLCVYDRNESKIKNVIHSIRVTPKSSAIEIVKSCDIILFAVKPYDLPEILQSIKHEWNSQKLLISVAVGIPIQTYEDILGKEQKIIRTMPNTPVMVKEGMTLLSCNDNITEEDQQMVRTIFESVGKAEWIQEQWMNEVTAVTGSSPAYVFMLIEAMIDAAVKSGLPKESSYHWAAQAVLGSAKLMLETGKPPKELRDQICSPKGTTIEAIYELEKNNFCNTVMTAMNACTLKAREIGKKYGNLWNE